MLSRKLHVLILSLILSVNSGCARSTTETVRTISDYKLLAFPISYANGTDTDGIDTKQTVDQIKKHNSRYECVVNNDCPVASVGITQPNDTRVSSENTTVPRDRQK